MRLSAALAKQGVTLPPERIRDHPTISLQASVAALSKKDGNAGDAIVTNVPQEEVVGTVPLSNVQLSALVSGLSWHFSCAVLCAVQQLNLSSLKSALSTIISHHDMLRVVFEVDGKPSTDYFHCTQRILSNSEVTYEDLVKVIEVPNQGISDILQQMRADMEIKTMPLSAVVVNSPSSSDGTIQYILLVVHPLVVDLWSWQILLSDLHVLYLPSITYRQKKI
jgi:Condensation domain